MTRGAALASLALVSVACNSDADPTGSNNNNNNSSTATISSTASTSSSAASSTSATTAGGSGPTSVSNGTGGASSTSSTSSATEGTVTTGEATTVGGAAGAPDDTTTAGTTTASTDGGTGGTGASTSEGSFVIEDDCGSEAEIACGGDLVNSDWEHVRGCVKKEAIVGPLQTVCESIQLVSSKGALTGSISFADTTFTQDVHYGFLLEFEVPADCNLTCDTVAGGLAVLGFPGATCEGTDASGCHCDAVADGFDVRSGDYATADSTLTLGYDQGSYCVGEDSLTYMIPVQLVPQGTPFDVVYQTVPQ